MRADDSVSHFAFRCQTIAESIAKSGFISPLLSAMRFLAVHIVVMCCSLYKTEMRGREKGTE